MLDDLNQVVSRALGNWTEGIELVEKLFTVAEPGAVFSQPVVAGEHTVITASEVMVGLGFGYGAGAGSDEEEADVEAGEAEEETAASLDVGGGGGGGGGAFGRPVAAISIGPDGVRVRPVVDVTKIGLALFTTVGSIFLMASRIRRASSL